MKRSELKSKVKRRDFRLAVQKKNYEGRCRVCKTTDSLECAHVIPRALSEPGGGLVKEEATVPLCTACHGAYDANRLDLLPYLKLHEQVAAVEPAGGLYRAYKRITGEEL